MRPLSPADSRHVGKASFNGTTVTTIEPQALSLLAQRLADCAHLLRPGTCSSSATFLEARSLAERPLRRVRPDEECEHRGGRVLRCARTPAPRSSWGEGQQVWTGANDAAGSSAGIRRTYTETNLR